MSKHSTGGRDRAAYLAQIVNRTRRLGGSRWDARVTSAKARVESKSGRGADHALLEAMGIVVPTD
ncbi:MAG TPA: hypothetical protein VFE13_20005 [Caulobacteraceae bacterium]|jgi:hypothetical protein|nr:hypothetical protein [Caulobacteraceae bacterium]